MNLHLLLYTHNKEEQHSYIHSATSKGYEVLNLEGPLVSHLISKLESTNNDIQFARVDADTIENLIKKEEATVSKLTDEEKEKLKPMIENAVSAVKCSRDATALLLLRSLISTSTEPLRTVRSPRQRTR